MCIQDCAAIKVCARKIANFYGDIRRALQVLRRALESLEEGKKIHPADINKAANDLFDSPLKDSILLLPRGLK
ncbi:origin recognition complex 1 protein, putative [Eimeria maxima]|uniref:Origin recognition complex subunit 1 n=1 Tax=Eimeria maxima TaxID=5804 RepID=U6M135_EIMMA|nr:origin recognition complex 1 protein, putative [Eimeria maxima]CDJ56139.1 origin recognition complex 1 protein, putative [Eimeria maxima]